MSGDADQIIGIYRRHAQAWAQRRGSQLRERSWLEKFERLLPATPSVLDIGCGSGDPIGRYLSERGYEVTGLDTSPELIRLAQGNITGANWIVADMRGMDLHRTFDGLIAWDSFFHLTPDNQRRMFPVFARHAAPSAPLMFTSGPRQGEAIGDFEGEALYHSSLDSKEYRALLARHGFETIDHCAEDETCGRHTVWLARFCGRG